MGHVEGIPTRRILWRHALRPSILKLLTVAGALIGGSVVVENLFQLAGMGKLLFFAILVRQFVELQSLVAVIAVGYVLVNVAVDVRYTVLDPRIRDARALA
jgi:peptide/nickel transport system permease protein